MTAARNATSHVRRAALGLATAIALLGSLLVVGAAPANAAVGVPVTYDGHSYNTVVKRPTENKPQSKLWYADGSWWALMVSPGDNFAHIYRLLANHTWADTGTVVDRKVNSTGDALWVPEDNKLHVISRDDTSMQVARFSYNVTTDAWSMDGGYPITLSTSGKGSESATIDQDSQGRLWVTYTQASRLWVAFSDTNGMNWSAGFQPTVTGGTTITSDDISALIAFDDKIGVMWSDQLTGKFRFAIHQDTGDPRTGWALETVSFGATFADDHINLKQLTGDSQGRIFAAIKTSNDAAGASAPLVGVLSRTPRADGTGDWAFASAGTVADDHTRPIIQIDETNDALYFFATAPVSGGDIYYKKTSLDNPSFGTGRGIKFVDSAAQVNNASGSKHSVTAATGMVVLAVAEGKKRYVHAEMELAGGGGTPPPPADTTAPSQPTNLTATPSAGQIALDWADSSDDVGVAGYTVRRNDGPVRNVTTSALTDTAVTAGTTYSYTVQAFDAAGNRSAQSASVSATVPNEPPPVSGPIVLSGVSTAANSAVNTLVLPRPADAQPGDLLLASVDVRGQPTITAPDGWALLRLDINGTAMRKATYWRIATSGDPATYTWGFSTKPAAVGVMLAYSGVSASDPIDTSSGLVTTSSTVVKAPSVTTTAENAQLVGLFGVARAADLTAPPGMQERAEVDSPSGLSYPMTASTADVAVSSAGATGDKSATSTVKGPNIGQLIVLRPAS